MSCSECMGYGAIHCPICSDEPEMIECDNCNGARYIYFDEDGNEVDYDEYVKSPDKYEKETCDKCNGTGEVEVESYEPDPNVYD